MKLKIYNKLYKAYREEQLELRNDTDFKDERNTKLGGPPSWNELRDFVNHEYRTAHAICRSVLTKIYGKEEFQKLTTADLNADLAWLLSPYAELDGFDTDSVKFTVRSKDSKPQRYEVPLVTFMGLSDRDFATNVRTALDNPKRVFDRCIVVDQLGTGIPKSVLLKLLAALKS